MATWRKLLAEVLAQNDESWSDIEATTLSDQQLDREFDAGYGGSEGDPFTVWTAKRVYFPAVYDGAEWVAFVSRHPDNKPTCHVGGE
jgi:hypothetical protein